jgi:hypothetical protein
MSKRTSKLVAEESLVLSIYDLNKLKLLTDRGCNRKIITWTNGEVRSNQVSLTIIERRIALIEYAIRRNGESIPIKLKIDLTTQRCNLSGYRYWFSCPICKGKAGKLYNLNGIFVCRRCGDVTYYSKNWDRHNNSYILNRCIKMENKLSELSCSITKTTYRNKPTRKYQKYLCLYSKLHSYDSYLNMFIADPDSMLNRRTF